MKGSRFYLFSITLLFFWSVSSQPVLKTHSFSSGTGTATSTSFQLNGSAGEIIGSSASTSFSLSSGFSSINQTSSIGLVAHYPLDGNTSEVSGNEYHGSLNGGPLKSEGVTGIADQGIAFDGIDDQVYHTLSSPINFTATTLSAWVYLENPSDMSGNYQNIISIENETEVSAADKLFSFRNLNDLFHSISFDTISAIGKNAALPHYRYDKNNPIPLKKNTIYLFDSGGQYYDGTTDITRTVILGKPTKEQKEMFTRVLKGHISLSTHTFPKKTKGTDIDYLARSSLQEIGCDYDHGTGHGIGSFLSVHEAPQRISKKNMYPSVDLLSGMILSNEPGFYKEGEYGIRIENILIVTEENENLFNFENISWAPIDKDLIEPSLLNSNDLKWLNNYHQTVFDKLSTFLTAEEKLWLQKVTLPL